MRPEVPTTERLRAMYMENGFVVVPPYRYSPVQQGDEFVVERTNMLEQTTVIIGQGPFQTMAQAASWLQSQGFIDMVVRDDADPSAVADPTLGHPPSEVENMQWIGATARPMYSSSSGLYAVWRVPGTGRYLVTSMSDGRPTQEMRAFDAFPDAQEFIHRIESATNDDGDQSDFEYVAGDVTYREPTSVDTIAMIANEILDEHGISGTAYVPSSVRRIPAFLGVLPSDVVVVVTGRIGMTTMPAPQSLEDLDGAFEEACGHAITGRRVVRLDDTHWAFRSAGGSTAGRGVTPAATTAPPQVEQNEEPPAGIGTDEIMMEIGHDPDDLFAGSAGVVKTAQSAADLEAQRPVAYYTAEERRRRRRLFNRILPLGPFHYEVVHLPNAGQAFQQGGENSPRWAVQRRDAERPEEDPRYLSRPDGGILFTSERAANSFLTSDHVVRDSLAWPPSAIPSRQRLIDWMRVSDSATINNTLYYVRNDGDTWTFVAEGLREVRGLRSKDEAKNMIIEHAINWERAVRLNQPSRAGSAEAIRGSMDTIMEDEEVSGRAVLGSIWALAPYRQEYVDRHASDGDFSQYADQVDRTDIVGILDDDVSSYARANGFTHRIHELALNSGRVDLWIRTDLFVLRAARAATQTPAASEPQQPAAASAQEPSAQAEETPVTSPPGDWMDELGVYDALSSSAFEIRTAQTRVYSERRQGGHPQG